MTFPQKGVLDACWLGGVYYAFVLYPIYHNVVRQGSTFVIQLIWISTFRLVKPVRVRASSEQGF